MTTPQGCPRIFSLSALVLDSVIGHLSEAECRHLQKSLTARTNQLKYEAMWTQYLQRVEPLLAITSDYEQELRYLLTEGIEIREEFSVFHQEIVAEIEKVQYRLPSRPETARCLGLNVWVTVVRQPHAVRICADGSYYTVGAWNPPQRLVDFVTFLWNHGFWPKPV